MGVEILLESVQYVVDKDGQQTAVLMDLQVWEALRQLLEDLDEDERLARLMDEVTDDEKLQGETAWELYQSFRSDPQS